MKWYNKDFRKLEKLQEKIDLAHAAAKPRRRKKQQSPNYNTWGMIQDVRAQLSRMGYRMRNGSCVPRYIPREGALAAVARRMIKSVGGVYW